MHYPPARIIPVEDAFVGVLALAQGIAARDLLTFQEPPRGSHQTREMFIDQILVHRVVEPFKALLADAVLQLLGIEGRGLPSTARMAASQKAFHIVDAPDDDLASDKDDQRCHSEGAAGALTGKADAIIYDASYREPAAGGAATRPRGRRRRRKGKRRRKRDEK